MMGPLLFALPSSQSAGYYCLVEERQLCNFFFKRGGQQKGKNAPENEGT